MTLIGYVMANAPTIRVAFEKFCNYQRIIGDSMGIEIHRDDDTSTIKIQQWSEWHDALRYTVDVMMAAIPGWASANAPRPIKPIRVGFRYERPMDTEPYDTMFAPAPVTFGADTSFQIYDNSVLDQPVMGANNDMFSHFEDKAKILLNDYEGRDSYAFKARQFIARKLQGETPTVNELARELAVSVRKLQSELATEGTKFSILLNEVRRDLAIKYLRESSVSKAEIAYLLGYSEMSVFSRSFKKWTGLTPSEFQDRE
jgi:AraC-like DNA-binding protein